MQPLVLWVVGKPVRSRLTPVHAQRPLGSCIVNELIRYVATRDVAENSAERPICTPAWLQLVLLALSHCWPCQIWSGYWEPIDCSCTKLWELFRLGTGLQQERWSLTFSTASVLTTLFQSMVQKQWLNGVISCLAKSKLSWSYCMCTVPRLFLVWSGYINKIKSC